MAKKPKPRPAATRPRAVIIHGLEEARAVCIVARTLGVAVELHSPPGAAATMGPLWFQQMMAEIGAAFPDLAIDGVFDCGDAPGYALAALRQGVKRIRLTGSRAALRKVEDIARLGGARVETKYPAALDLAQEVDIDAACRAWLGA